MRRPTPAWLILISFAVSLVCPAAQQPSPFCSDCAATRGSFRQLCDYIVANKADFPAIFVGGYYMRTLVAGWEILGDRRYLETAEAYADRLLAKQSPKGYWATGYGNIYLADTGSALGLFAVLYKYAPPERQQRYLKAVERYAKAVQSDGLINPSGAFGVGFHAKLDGTITGPYPDEYTISSALSGGEIFTWLYRRTKNDHYRQVAHKALQWVLGTMRQDGAIPYVLAGQGADLHKHGDPQNDYNLWQKNVYQSSSYVGEGIIAFDEHCGNRAWRDEVRERIRPQIEFLIRTQNADGTWAPVDSNDQKRTPGIADLLIWYYDEVHKDPKVLAAIRKFDRVLADPAKAREFGLLSAGNPDVGGGPKHLRNDVLTCLAGRAMADILSPGIDSKW